MAILDEIRKEYKFTKEEVNLIHNAVDTLCVGGETTTVNTVAALNKFRTYINEYLGRLCE